MTTVMVVDDAAFVRAKYRKSLGGAGYEVIEAASGNEAVARYEEDPPDVVLLDINMPGMNGIVTLHEIMKMDPGARVAMVTAMGAQSIILTAMRAGARDFVIKPSDEDGIVRTVERLIS